MKKINNLVISVFFSLALILLLLFQYNVENNDISLSGEEVCAQTGTCQWMPPDNCYVNGEKDPNRRWNGSDNLIDG